MPVSKLVDFLNENKIKYATIKHSLAYTSQEIAASAHIRGKELAKSVLVKIDGKMAMFVLPASHHIDFEALKKVFSNQSVRLANEVEFKDKFGDCEVGAMPPFGNLFGMEVYVEEILTKDEMIAFNACSHTELLQLHYTDYERLVKPVTLRFSYHSKL